MKQADLLDMAPASDPWEIPGFLKRRELTPSEAQARRRELEKAETAERVRRADADAVIFEKRRLAESRKRVPADERERLAFKVDAAVRAGHDTFGKLRKHLGLDDKALRAAIRAATKEDESGVALLTTQGRRYRPA